MKWQDRLIIGIFGVCVLVLLWQIAERVQRPILRTITVTNAFAAIYENQEILMTHESKWRYISDPNTTPPTITVHTVLTTFRDAGHETETIAEFDARHQAKVDADRLTFPPIAS